jgi:HlyD family secretion protein
LKRISAVAACLIVAALLWRYFHGSAAPQYRTQTLQRGEIQASVTATGTCNAVVTVQVGSQVSGNIKALYADFNTQVKKGQLVALIDPELFQAKVQQARANLSSAQAQVVNAQAALRKAGADLAAAQANLANQRSNAAKAKVATLDAKSKLDRRQEMFETGIISAEDLETAQAAYDAAVAAEDAANAQIRAAEESVQSAMASKDVAQAQSQAAAAQVAQSQALLAQAETDLRHTEIRAPVNGTVIARNVDVGQTVAASFTAPTIFQIAEDLTRMQVDTNVDESDIGRVLVGQKATFTVDAYPGTTFPAEVVQIRQAAINTQNVISYDVVIAISNADRKLFPGMTANVTIITDTVKDVLKLPNAALRVRISGTQSGDTQMRVPGASTVWTLENDKPRPVHVRLGVTDGMYSAIEEGGLKEGMSVIVGTTATTTPAAKAPAGGPRF